MGRVRPSSGGHADWDVLENQVQVVHQCRNPRAFVPREHWLVLLLNCKASVTSARAVRLELIAATDFSSSVRDVSVPSSKPTIEMCTFAPSRIHSRSLMAKKISPCALTRSRTSRLA